MQKETYESLELTVIMFDSEDVIKDSPIEFPDLP